MQKGRKQPKRKWMKIVSVLLVLILTVGSYTPVTALATTSGGAVTTSVNGAAAESGSEATDLGRDRAETASTDNAAGVVPETGTEDADNAAKVADTEIVAKALAAENGNELAEDTGEASSDAENADNTGKTGAENAGNAEDADNTEKTDVENAGNAEKTDVENAGNAEKTDAENTGNAEDADNAEETDAEDADTAEDANNAEETDAEDANNAEETDAEDANSAEDALPGEQDEDAFDEFESEMFGTGTNVVSVSYEGMPANETHAFETYDAAKQWMDEVDENDGKNRDYTITYLNKTILEGLTVTSLTTNAKSITLASAAHWDQSINENREVHAFILRNISTDIPVIFQTEIRIGNASSDISSFASIEAHARILIQGKATIGELQAVDNPSPQHSYDKVHLGSMGSGVVDITHLTMGGGELSLSGFEPMYIKTLDLTADTDKLDVWWLGGNISDENVSYIFFKTETNLENMNIKFSNNVSNVVEKIVNNNDGTWQLEIKKDDTKHFRITCDEQDYEFTSWGEALRWMEYTMNNANKDYIVSPINYDPDAQNSYYWEHIDGLPRKAKSITFNKVVDGSDPQSRFYYYLNSQRERGEHIECALILNAYMDLDEYLVYDDLTLNGVLLHLERNLNVGNLTLANTGGSVAGFTSGTFGTFGQPGYDFGRITITGTLTGMIQFFSVPNTLQPGDALITYSGKLEQNQYHVQGNYTFEVVDNKDGTSSLVVVGGGGGMDTPEPGPQEKVDSEDIPDGKTEDDAPNGLWISAIPAQTYTGTAIIPSAHVYYGKIMLREGKDYTITCKNNVNAAQDSDAKAPTVTVKGKGNYSGSASAKFTINKADITSAILAVSVYAPRTSYKPVIMSPQGVVFKSGKDYTLKYAKNDGTELSSQPKEAGEYKLTVTGVGSCTGGNIYNFSISESGKSISKAVVTIENMTFGKAVPKPVVKLSAARGAEPITLKEDIDYKVSYTGIGKKGNAKVIITGIGIYSGSKSKTFKVNAETIKTENVSVSASAVYKKGGAKPRAVVTVGGTVLLEGVDYTVSYSKNSKLSTSSQKAKATIKGKGNYTGTVAKEFMVVARSLNDSSIKICVPDVLKGKKPAVVLYDSNGSKLTAKKDYSVVIGAAGADGKGTVTIKGGSNKLYTAASDITVRYTVREDKDLIWSAKLKKGYTSYDYTGKAVVLDKANIEVKTKAGSVVPAESYTITYVNNVAKGTAVAIIRAGEGSGVYGTKILTFKIKANKLTGFAEW